MPYYVVLLNLTDQGVRNIKESPQRVARACQAVEAAGGRWLGFYYTFGRYDGVAIIEGPSDEVALGLLLAIGSQGSIRSETLKAIPLEEAEQIIARLP